MVRFAFLVLAASLLPITFAAAAETPKEKPFLVGAATANITPWLGGGLVGNFGTPPPAKYVHDELHARCFVLDDGTTRIVLVVSDNIYMSREVLDEAKRQVTEATGIPADHMLMSCTHTHSSVSARWPKPARARERIHRIPALRDPSNCRRRAVRDPQPPACEGGLGHRRLAGPGLLPAMAAQAGRRTVQSLWRTRHGQDESRKSPRPARACRSHRSPDRLSRLRNTRRPTPGPSGQLLSPLRGRYRTPQHLGRLLRRIL